MSNETMVTIQGWVANEPVVRTVSGHEVVNFRVGVTPRRFHRSRQEWVDGQTQWYAVSAWRALAANCGRSLHKGDPVIVHGRLDHRTYINASNLEVVALEIEALTVGHDLCRGFGNFLKSPARQPAGVPERDAVTSAPDPFPDVKPKVAEALMGDVHAA
ncbi:single-stranded DNA-binding protein [Nocardioides maradonensis]